MTHHVTLQGCPPAPWRNGGGSTRELLRWPAEAADGAWRLRVSVARIDRDGPFSPFPGVQRCFAVLHGAGVRLGLRDGDRWLAAGDEAIAFDGADAPACALRDGPTDDLNLMAPFDAGQLGMHRAADGRRIDGPTRWRGVYAHDAQILHVGDQAEPLTAGTLAWSDAPGLPAWTLSGSGLGWLLWLDPPHGQET